MQFFAADESRLLLLAVAFAEANDVPAAISHLLDIQAMGSFSIAPEPFSYRAGVIDLSTLTAPIVSPPLQGAGWIAAEGCCDPASHHVNGVFPINGTFYAGQRFAIDFIQINDDGMLVEPATSPTSTTGRVTASRWLRLRTGWCWMHMISLKMARRRFSLT